MKILITLTTLFIAVSAFSQSIPINYGQSYYGDLEFPSQVDTYTFEASIGDRIYIRMRDAETPVDACFTLVDPIGNTVAEECGNGGIVMLKNYEIMSAGTYTIIAHDAKMNDTGKYGISLNLLNNPQYADPIDCGYDGEFALTTTTEVKTYTFEANAGDVLKARMRGESSSFESEIEIYDAAGNQLDADYGSGLSQIENLVFPYTGSYTIIANDRNGNDLGLFGISIQLVNRMDCAVPISCGDNQIGTIDKIAAMSAYTFNIGGKAPVIAQAKSLNQSFETQLMIYNNAGQLIRTTEGSSSLQNITATFEAGEYLVIAMDRGGNDKADYGVALQYLGAENCANEIICQDNSSTESLPTPAAMKAYRFQAFSGEKVTPEVGALAEHLDPEILLMNRSGNILAEDYSFSVTTLEDVVLENSGVYVAIVRDWHGNDVGGFKFSLTSETIFSNTVPEPDVEELEILTAECELTLTRPTAIDPCEGALVAHTDDPMFYDEQGTYTVTWIFENSQGGTITQQQTVIIEDKTAPIIYCNESLTFHLSENGEFFLTENHLTELIDDACSEVAWIELEQNYFDCSMAGENIVKIWTADAAGNESTCEFVINIMENDACNSTIECGELPDNWYLADIGDPSGEGSVCYDPASPTFEITSYGEDIFGTEDEFTYVYQEICGNSVVQAKVTDLTGDTDYAFAGIMMRKNNNPGSKYAALLASPEKGVFYQVRLKKDEYTLYEAHHGKAPVWIKLERIGKLISGYISEDAIEWELACEIDVTLGECYEIGLAVSAFSDTDANTGTINQVQISNIEGLATADNRSFRVPSSLETTDPCQFAIDHRGDVADCNKFKLPEPIVSIFPNPTSDQVNIDASDFRGKKVTITIADNQGNTYYSKSFEQAPVNLPLNVKSLGLRNGYNSVIIDDGEFKVAKTFLVIDER